MRDLLLTLLIIGALPYVLMRPHIGILLWSWLGYMNPHRLTYGFAYTMPFTVLAAAFTIVALIFSKERKTFPWSRVTVIWLFFVFWTFITFFFAINPEDALIELDRMIKIQIMIVCTLLLINSKERLIQLVWVIAMSIGFFGVKGGVFALATGFNYKVSGPDGSFISENNTIALALLMVIPLMYFLFAIEKRRLVKMALAGAILLTFFSVVASYSRGAFLGMAVMTFFLWLGTKRKLMTMGLILAIVVAGIPFIPDKWFDRMNTIETYDQDESAMGRINAWKFAVNLANDRPIVGGGYRAFSPEAFYIYAPEPDRYHDAHSIYFEILGEQGYIGLLLFLAIWALVFLEARKVKKMAKGHEELQWAVTLVTMVQVGLIAYMTSGAFLGLGYFDLPYHFMSLVVIASVLCRNHLTGKEPSFDKRSLSPVR